MADLRAIRGFIVCLAVVLALLAVPPAMGAPTNGEGEVQVLTGTIENDTIAIYVLPNLEAGDTLTVAMNRTSGNLDPFIAIGGPEVLAEGFRERYDWTVETAMVRATDPLVAIPEIADDLFYAWDDDSGTGYAAALTWKVLESGDYVLLAGSTPMEDTFGDYQVTLDLTPPREAGIAIPDSLTGRVGVAEVTGTLSANRTSTFYILADLFPDDTVYAFIETTSDEIAPVLILADYGDKPVRSANLLAPGKNASLQYTIDSETRGSRLTVLRNPAAAPAANSTYRLLVGLNEPAVLTDTVEPGGRTVIKPPIIVKAAVELDQITDVDQKSENYGVVANIMFTWTDPVLAFSPDTCHCPFKIYRSIEDFVKAEGTRWPEFTINNQQGNRWTQNRLIQVFPDGRAIYFERFWVTLQAPDFNFRDFPFDTQHFFLRIDALYPEEYFLYADWEGRTVVGTQLGEEEWYITRHWTNITSSRIENTFSRFSFDFEAKRHLTYYILRIFAPIFILVLLAWVTFLLRDYGKRADVASANLLLFIAFNFTIAGDLPRLGYRTFLDSVLITTFVVSGLVVIYNLYLKWLATIEQKEVAERIDRVMVWFYPFAYFIGLGVTILLFP
ncbi:MAG: hypothetical protein PHP59_05860 [Methanofollis sp.]|uniref:hypothetical protein n=1 Tax=Methanofollis sp. TaxID=2052835 RepID=UPI00260A7D8A|nr:hypothetical protein [Methanofollis sp.]MDD4254886.1 hypothetical protein [Methanofollis sp.]